MKVLRSGPRLPVTDQVIFKLKKRANGPHPWRGCPLAIEIVSEGERTVRAGDAFIHGKLRLRAPILTVKGASIEIRTPAGRQVAPEALEGLRPEEIDKHLEEVDRLATSVASRLEMYFVFPTESLTEHEITVGLFREVMQGYDFTGDHAGELQAILADPAEADNPVTRVSLTDGREFARRLSKLRGEEFRLPTEEEWKELWFGSEEYRKVGRNLIWTETPAEEVAGRFVLRSANSGYSERDDKNYLSLEPDKRPDNAGLLLVRVDKKAA